MALNICYFVDQQQRNKKRWTIHRCRRPGLSDSEIFDAECKRECVRSDFRWEHLTVCWIFAKLMLAGIFKWAHDAVADVPLRVTIKLKNDFSLCRSIRILKTIKKYDGKNR